MTRLSFRKRIARSSAEIRRHVAETQRARDQMLHSGNIGEVWDSLAHGAGHLGGTRADTHVDARLIMHMRTMSERLVEQASRVDAVVLARGPRRGAHVCASCLPHDAHTPLLAVGAVTAPVGCRRRHQARLAPKFRSLESRARRRSRGWFGLAGSGGPGRAVAQILGALLSTCANELTRSALVDRTRIWGARR